MKIVISTVLTLTLVSLAVAQEHAQQNSIYPALSTLQNTDILGLNSQSILVPSAPRYIDDTTRIEDLKKSIKATAHAKNKALRRALYSFYVSGVCAAATQIAYSLLTNMCMYTSKYALHNPHLTAHSNESWQIYYMHENMSKELHIIKWAMKYLVTLGLGTVTVLKMGPGLKNLMSYMRHSSEHKALTKELMALEPARKQKEEKLKQLERETEKLEQDLEYSDDGPSCAIM